MKFLKLFLIVFLIVPVFSFAEVKDELSGKEFISVKYPSILIGFRNGGVYGYALVNTYMGTYEIKAGNKINLSYMTSTKMEGTMKENDGEYEYFDYLKKAKTYSYDEKTGKLILGKMEFKQKK